MIPGGFVQGTSERCRPRILISTIRECYVRESGRRTPRGHDVNTNQSAVALGWQYLQAGNLAAADETVRPLLARELSDELVPLVGAIRLQQGRFSEAAPMFERARALHPGQARFAYLHGTALARP